MKLTLAAFLLPIAFASQTTYGQVDGKLYRTDAAYLSTVKVTADGNEKTLAWTGGFNNPQFAVADLNHDGRKDLVVYEVTNDPAGIKTFINHGTPGHPDLVYAPEYEYRFPYPYRFMKMLDYNCDNIPDYIYGTFVQYICDGHYDASNNWIATNCREIKYPVGAGVSNIPILSDDIPGIEDVDDDGDLDVTCFTKLGWIEYYRSMRVEDGKPCDSLQIKFKDRCWGKVKQDAPREHWLAMSCDNSGLKTTKSTDFSNGICLFDADGDKDMDVLVGNVQYSDIQFLKNGRKEYNYPVDTMVAQDTTWQSGGKKLYMPTYPMAYWVDVDDDTDKDIVISPQVSGENYHCVAYYKNTGSTSSPAYTYQSDSFLVDEMIDLGSNSYPIFYDYDKDGRKDLFIGSRGFYVSNGIYKTALYYFKNTTTGSNISFDLADRRFLNMDTTAAQGAALAIGDIDNDGLDDLVAGRLDGTMAFYKNYASGAGVQPIWKLYQPQLKDSAGAVIDVSNYAAPCIYDIDKDGKKDLIIGNQSGYLSYYKNTGNGSLRLTYKTNKLGNVKVVPDQSYGFSAPFFGPVDNLEQDYLMVGCENGVIYRYTGFQTGDVTTPFTMKDSMYSEIRIPGKYIAPAFANLDNDKKYELVAGNEKGGVFFYRQVWDVHVDELNTDRTLEIYPNPAQNEIRIVNNRTIPYNAGFKIYDNTGRQLAGISKTIVDKQLIVSISALPPGVYFCSLYINGIIKTAVFVKQ